MGKDLHNNISVRRCIDPVSISTNVATVSQIIDRLGYEALEFLICSGAIASGTAVFTVTAEHGDSPTLADTQGLMPPDPMAISNKPNENISMLVWKSARHIFPAQYTNDR